MLETLRNAFKIKDIRNRIIFTFLMLVVIRIGSQLPIPGVNNELFSNWFASQTADGMGFFDAITGGSFYNMSIFALNITPYITSSIIMQLLTIAIPKLEEMQRDGEEGRKKIAEITRYLTVALALIEAIAMAISFKRGQMLQSDGILTIIMVIFTLTAGSAVLMWIGERITEKGVGNGISIVLTINIISRVPNDMGTLYQQFITGKSIPKGILAAVMIIAIIVVVALGVVLWRGKAGLEEKNADYQAQITELQSQIDDENKRSDELSEYEKYVKTKKFVEEIAKNKFGLIYPDELVFKPNNK